MTFAGSLLDVESGNNPPPKGGHNDEEAPLHERCGPELYVGPGRAGPNPGGPGRAGLGRVGAGPARGPPFSAHGLLINCRFFKEKYQILPMKMLHFWLFLLK